MTPTSPAATAVPPSQDAAPAQGAAFLPTLPAGPHERQRAYAVMLASAMLFAAIAPFAKVQLPAVPAFIPIYESALVVTDLITAVLLFGQYRILRSQAVLALGSGYLFTAAITIGHALTFPGLFAPAGLLGAGMQSTAWIYMFWHAGFPLFVLAYALLRRREHAATAAGRVTSGVASWVWPALGLLGALALVALATAGQALLPAIMQGNRYTPAMIGTVTGVWAFSLIALGALWKQPERSVLDMWLMVVLVTWLFDIALSAMLNAGRYDLGFYAGRIYGLVACGAVLLDLLLENGVLYARLAQAHEAERRRGVELAFARDEAQAANEAKSLFLASMSHEIRTPMNAVIGLTQLVLQTRLDDRQRDYLTKVQASSKALLSLLNDILDYSKIEAGKVSLEEEEFSTEETIENVGNLFSARIEEAGLDLFYKIDKSIPQRLLGDALRLTQVLNNLVGNAIKFTPRGEIVIHAELLSREDAHVVLRFQVRDTGIGLAPEQAERLFQAFAQADKTIGRRYGGTGLGLAICKRLVELMGGQIRVTSEPGQGSCFEFTARFGLPRGGVERKDLQQVRGMRTLVLDSQPTGRLVLQQMLQAWRFQVGTAAFPDDALHKLRRADPAAPYELLVVDWRTADAAFVREARRIVEERSQAPLAVVGLMSMHTRGPVEDELPDEPGTGALKKPVTPSRLLETIMRLQHGDTPRPPAKAPPRMDIAEALAPIRGARVLLAEDNLVNQQVASAFLAMGGLQVTLAATGIEAVDFVKKQRFDAVLMDMQMPEMDGVQAARVIRGLEHGGHLPIIAMTAAAMPEDVQECLAAGMNAHVAKPIDPAQMARTLLAWVAPRQPAARTDQKV